MVLQIHGHKFGAKNYSNNKDDNISEWYQTLPFLVYKC